MESSSAGEPVLTLDGAVERPRRLSLTDLAAIDARWQIPDVSAWAPSRKGTGVTLAGLLNLVGVRPAATHVTLHATADDFHASVPLAAVRERGFVIYQADGQPLPASAGGPFRFFIRDYLACHSAEVDECANVKFVDRIELTVGPGRDNRPHDDEQHAALHARETTPARIEE